MFFLETKSAITVLGVIVIVMVMIIVAYFLAKTAPLLIKKAWIGVVFLELFYYYIIA